MLHNYSRIEYRKFKRHIGRNIQDIHRRRNMTLVTLSRFSGLSVKLLDRYEVGRNSINLRELFVIACALGVDAKEVLGN